jgi:tRNA threonylcarbamoyladenosine biosynthesis protein TsaB
MSVLLHINTALPHAYVALSDDDRILGVRECTEQKEHSAFLQPAIQVLLEQAPVGMDKVAAVTVINGPGSYTGLRVGLSAAKGLCYALNIPLICLSTLEWLAWPFRSAGAGCIAAVIDARRKEVFTAAYDAGMQTVLSPMAMILDDDSYSGLLEDNPVMFTGDGTAKLPIKIRKHPNFISGDIRSNWTHQADMAYQRFVTQDFSDLALADPFYIKPFHSTSVQ